MDFTPYLPAIGTLLGGGAIVQLYNSFISRPKVAAEAEKMKAEAEEIMARARKTEREIPIGPDQQTIEMLLKTLSGLQDQLNAQAKLFADREVSTSERERLLLSRIDEMEKELVDLRQKNGRLIDQVTELRQMVAANGEKADRNAKYVMAHLPREETVAMSDSEISEDQSTLFPPG